MSPEVFQQFLEIVLRTMSVDDQHRLADELRARSRHRLLRQQAEMIRSYRRDYYSGLSEREAARRIEQDLSRFAAGSSARLVIPPAGNPKQAALFEILGTGPLLGHERIRQILRPHG